jgi:peptide deformylase
VRSIRLYGDPALREKALEVVTFDDALREFVRDLFETMHAYHGVGLAANQVGVLQRVLVVDVPSEDRDGERSRHTLVNPRLEERSGGEDGEEGCLSIPGIFEDVRRATRLRVRAQDEFGRPLDFVAEDYLARAIQHEVDHLDGVLFVDRLSPLKRQFLKRPLEALARGEMPEGYEPPTGTGGAR